MVLDSPITIYFFGCVGGALTELLHWWNLRTHTDLPHYKSSKFYWGITFAMILAGGIVAWLYFGSNADAVVVLHVGISTPLILQKLVTSTPDAAHGAKSALTQPKPSIRRFFNW